MTVICSQSDTRYSQNVTVTATYNGQTASTTITLYNKIEGITQISVPSISATPGTDHPKVVIGGDNLVETIRVVYCNGKYIDTAPTDFILDNGTLAEDDVRYVQDVTANYVTTETRTIKIEYTDSRGSGQKVESGYQVNVYNTATGVKSGTQLTCTMTDATSWLTPSGGIYLVLSNGQTMWAPDDDKLSYSSVSPATSDEAQECVDRTTTVTCVLANDSTFTGEVNCRVINPVKGVDRYTDPEPVNVTSTSSISLGSLSNGYIEVTYTSNATRVVSVTETGNDDTAKYSVIDTLSITDNSCSKQCRVRATYDGAYSDPKYTDMQVILLNMPTYATLSTSSYVTLKTWGQRPSRKLVAHHPNGTTTDFAKINESIKSYVMDAYPEEYEDEYSSIWDTYLWQYDIDYIYKSGSTTDGEATTAFDGSCTVYARNIYVPGAKLDVSRTRMVNGVEGNHDIPSVALSNASATAYWKNAPDTVTVTSVSAEVADYRNATVAPTSMTLSVKWTNGATVTRTSGQTGVRGVVQNITDGSASKSVTCWGYYQQQYSDGSFSNEVSGTGSVTMYNPVCFLDIIYQGTTNIMSNSTLARKQYPRLQYTGENKQPSQSDLQELVDSLSGRLYRKNGTLYSDNVELALNVTTIIAPDWETPGYFWGGQTAWSNGTSSTSSIRSVAVTYEGGPDGDITRYIFCTLYTEARKSIGPSGAPLYIASKGGYNYIWGNGASEWKESIPDPPYVPW